MRRFFSLTLFCGILFAATTSFTVDDMLDVQNVQVADLSADGRYCRFMTGLNELPETLAERFACIDYRNHVALLAEVFEDGRETMIGEARYVVDERDPETCEFAIAVADDWQAHGIARAMLERLERQAASTGIRRMVADTLVTNKAMIQLAGRTGYVVRANRTDASLVRLKKVLPNPPMSCPTFCGPKAA